MTMTNDRYQSPLSERYASKEMQYIFSPDKKFRTWRRLWIALAQTEKELGLPITDEQIEELKEHADDINVTRICLWTAVPESERNHTPWGDILLCGRQYGYDSDV